MRQSRHSSSRSIPWRWIITILVIFGVLFFFRGFSGSSENKQSSDGLIVKNGSEGHVVITNALGKKRDLTDGGVLGSDDALLTVVTGTAYIDDKGIQIWLDKNSEFQYTGESSGSIGVGLSQGRTWIESTRDMRIKMKHIDLTLTAGDIVLLEQQRIFSIAYVIHGDIGVSASSERETTLTSGKRIMVSQSNLINPGTTLDGLIEDIDDSIQQNPFFLARDGKALLEKNDEPSMSISGVSLSGSLGTGMISASLNGKSITITSPADGSVISGNSVKVEGKILSPLVKKVTLNDVNATISGDTFASLPLPFETDTIDVVYKSYGDTANLLERGVLTLYSQEKKLGADKLVPTTFPTSDKDFRFISPKENPYKTSASAVTVSGTVPKGAVEYITVNNFRLKKFVPYSASWYYYANISYQTMKEGFNLYEIKFYGPNNTLLSTQLFTIIKEGGILSGE